jgi:hypothetical protein
MEAATMGIKPIIESKPGIETTDVPISIAKPEGAFLDKFKSKQAAAIANVETLLAALPVHKLSEAKDFVRLHPNESYWSPELCFVNVPIRGQKRDTLHLIEESLALRFLEGGDILRFRLALATKPHDVFFLCTIPTRNEDNPWNQSNLDACEKAKTSWARATSRKEEGVEAYKITFARDQKAFPEPNWPTQSLAELIEKTFAGRVIEDENHPALLRKIGARPSTS